MNTHKEHPHGWYKKHIHPTPEPASYGLVFALLVIGLVLWRRMKEK
jgi:hypothetical protein